MKLLVLVINRYWARWTDGYGSKAIPLQGSPDIINVLCVWQSNDPMLIQLHVANAAETPPSKMVEELRSLLQSSSGCFCFWVKAHFDTDQSHRLIAVTGLKSSLSSDQLKNILWSSLFLCCHALTLQKKYTKILFLLLGGGLYLVI